MVYFIDEKSISIKIYFDEINMVILNFQNVDFKVENEDQTLILLCLFPLSYDNFIDALLYRMGSSSLKILQFS